MIETTLCRGDKGLGFYVAQCKNTSATSSTNTAYEVDAALLATVNFDNVSWMLKLYHRIRNDLVEVSNQPAEICNNLLTDSLSDFAALQYFDILSTSCSYQLIILGNRGRGTRWWWQMFDRKSWTCQLGYGTDTMFHRTYFLFSVLLVLTIFLTFIRELSACSDHWWLFYLIFLT